MDEKARRQWKQWGTTDTNWYHRSKVQNYRKVCLQKPSVQRPQGSGSRRYQTKRKAHSGACVLFYPVRRASSVDLNLPQIPFFPVTPDLRRRVPAAIMPEGASLRAFKRDGAGALSNYRYFVQESRGPQDGSDAPAGVGTRNSPRPKMSIM